jgi:hypothetical protein
MVVMTKPQVRQELARVRAEIRACYRTEERPYSRIQQLADECHELVKIDLAMKDYGRRKT